MLNFKSSQKSYLNKVLISLGLVAILIAVALLSSAVIVFGGTKFIIYFTGGLIGLLFLFLPPQWLLSLLLGYVFLILGPLGSLANVDSIWGPYIMCLGLLFIAFFENVAGRKRAEVSRNKSNKFPPYIWSLLVLLSVSFFSTLNGNPNTYTLLISIRGLFLVWGVYFILSIPTFTPKFFRNVWIFLVTAGLLQLPMTIYQRFWVAPTRIDAAKWDSVIGTFPGTNLIGDSGGMAFFLISMAAITVSLWRHSQLGGFRTLFLAVLLIAPIMFGETKVSYILLPIMMTLIFRSELKRNPILFIVGVLIACVFVVGIFLTGKYLNYNEQNINHSINIEKEYEAIFGFSTNVDAYADGQMGRTTILSFWWHKNKDDPFHLVLGYGLGSSAIGNSYASSGSEGWKYRPTSISFTGAGTLLWDTGILGLLAYIGIFFLGAIRARKLAELKDIPPFHRAILYSASAILLINILLLPYFTASITTNTFLLLLLGMVSYWDKHVSTTNFKVMKNSSKNSNSMVDI